MSPQQKTDLIRRYAESRTAWLTEATRILAADTRIAAAWLFGSLGRGTPRDLSDIDLFIAFSDDAADEVRVATQWLQRLGPLLRARESPYNAPDCGRYFAAIYDGPALPLMVDCYLQPASAVLLGSDATVLFDRIGLRRDATGRTTFELIPAVRDAIVWVPPDDPLQRLQAEIDWFWFDLPIAAKRVLRGESFSAASQALLGILHTTESLLGARPKEHSQIATLNDLAAEMSRLLALDAAKDLRPTQPYEDAYRWINAADALSD